MIDLLKDYWWIITTFIVPVATYFVGRYKNKNEEQDKKIKMLLKDDKLTKGRVKRLFIRKN